MKGEMMFAAMLAVVLVAGAGFAWVRLAPSDPARWHVDPSEAEPGPGRFVVRLAGGDRQSPVLALSPAEALAAFDEVALAEPRTKRLAGSPGQGRITYVSRSKVVGFPDYTTVEAVPVDGGTALAVYARLRFGKSDLGVNETRVSRWLDAVVDGTGGP